MDIASVVSWVSENYLLVLGLVYMALNLVSGILTLIPGDQGEGEGGFLSKLRSVLDRISVLTAKDASGTVKMPLTASKALPPTE
jgi:hypothetical protein